LELGAYLEFGYWDLGFLIDNRPTGNESQMEANWEPKILAFLCNWCSYAGADLAGTSRIQYPPNIRVVRVPCSGRINPLFVLKALQGGIDGVLVSGCHPGDCHYLSGNYVGRRKSATLKRFLEYLGIEVGRVQFSWVSAAEGGKFSQVIEEVTQDIRRLGPAKQFRKRSDEFGVQSSE
jgi:F420-non-reducing hydrogenase iron-sulfur subunit